MDYTVKQLAKLAGVTPRTLRYYDTIGLLRPARSQHNDYRRYDEAALLRLQQILFYRELGFGLEDIAAVLDQPGFDLSAALRSHRKALQSEARRLERLIATVERTLDYLEGQTDMNQKKLFDGFSEEEQEKLSAEAEQRWGESARESSRRWKALSAEQKQAVLDEGKAVYTDLVAAIGSDPASPAVQALMARWHQQMRHFFDPSIEVLRGISQGYVSDPRFRATFDAMHPDLAEFTRAAAAVYCDRLEKA